MKPARLITAILLAGVLILSIPGLAAAVQFDDPLGGASKYPKVAIEAITKRFIVFLLGLSATVALASLIYGGLRLVLGASLSESEIARAKQIIFWSIVGLLVIGMAAAILAQLKVILNV
ncbi:MAG: hypothetical protein ABIH36_04055 [bacterium]